MYDIWVHILSDNIADTDIMYMYLIDVNCILMLIVCIWLWACVHAGTHTSAFGHRSFIGPVGIDCRNYPKGSQMSSTWVQLRLKHMGIIMVE